MLSRQIWPHEKEFALKRRLGNCTAEDQVIILSCLFTTSKVHYNDEIENNKWLFVGHVESFLGTASIANGTSSHCLRARSSRATTSRSKLTSLFLLCPISRVELSLKKISRIESEMRTLCGLIKGLGLGRRPYCL